MELIQVKRIGYGLDCKTLDLTIVIPKDSYLKEFWVATHNDIDSDNETRKGRDYISAIRNYEANIGNIIDEEAAFHKLFILSEECTIDNKEYSIYRINPTVAWCCDPVYENGICIEVSQDNLTFITMKIDGITDFSYLNDTCCGCDNTVYTIPLFDMFTIKLRALHSAKFIGCSCEFPTKFIDKILQIRVIELAIMCKDWYKASKFWKKFYEGKRIVTTKDCGCHGRII